MKTIPTKTIITSHDYTVTPLWARVFQARFLQKAVEKGAIPTYSSQYKIPEEVTIREHIYKAFYVSDMIYEFVYQDVHYRLSLRDNIFFPQYLVKSSIENDCVNLDHYGDDLPIPSDYTNAMYQFPFLGESEQEAFLEVFWDWSIHQPLSGLSISTERIQVPNVYSEGYHTETVNKPSRMAQLREIQLPKDFYRYGKLVKRMD